MGAQGTTTLNFGAFPGSVETSATVSGQTGLTASSLIEAWVFPVATADHSVDEHAIERIRVIAVYDSAGSFVIRGYNDDAPAWRFTNGGTAQPQRLYGLFTVGWVWN